MAELEKYYLDVSSARFYDADGAALNDLDFPSLFLGQMKQFELHLMYFDNTDDETSFLPYTQLTGMTLGYYFALDNDWVRWYEAALNTGYVAGPVASIAIKNLTMPSGKEVLSAGYIVLNNGTDDPETLEYESVVLVGGVYTFTLIGGSTLVASYSADDVAYYLSPPLALASGVDIDATDKDNGVFIITLDGDTESLEVALAEEARLSGVGFEFGGVDGGNQLKLCIQGESFYARNRRYFAGNAPPRSLTSDYYTIVQCDALFVKFTDMYTSGVYDWNVLVAYDGTSGDPDLVKRNGKIYKALTDNTGKAPESNPADWQDITSGGGGGTDELVKASAADTTADYLFEKVDNSQFEILNPAGDEQVSIKDGGLTQAKVANLESDLATMQGDISNNATAITSKLDEDLTLLPSKTNLDGSEKALVDDAGSNKTVSLSAIGDYVIENKLPDIDFTNGIATSVNEYGNEENGDHVAFLRTKDVADAEVVALLHMDGSDGDTLFVDDSTFAHTVSAQGDPSISNTQKYTGFGTSAYLDGDDGLYIGVSNFDPQGNDWGFACKAFIALANINDYMPLLHIGTGTTTSRVLYLFLNGGYLYFKIGTTTGAGDWTDQDSVEVYNAGYLAADDWNSFVFQRYNNELMVGLNGVLVMRIDMTSKTLNTPDGASKIRFGYDIDAGSSPDNFLTGYMDEIVLLDGAPFDASITGAPFEPFNDWLVEQFVTKKYDLDINGGDGAFRLNFVDADLVAGVLSVAHYLNETVVSITVYDQNGKQIIPDEVTLVDSDNATVDLTSYGTLSGTYRLVAISGGYGRAKDSRTGVYRTIYIDAAAMVPATTNGAEVSTEESSTTFVMNDMLLFDKDTDEYAQFKIKMPEEWDKGEIKAKFFWKDGAVAGTGNVIWALQAQAVADGDAIDSAWGTAQSITDTFQSSGDMHVTDATPAITIANNPTNAKMIYFRVYRDADNGSDSYSDDAALLGLAIQYKETETEPSAW